MSHMNKKDITKIVNKEFKEIKSILIPEIKKAFIDPSPPLNPMFKWTGGKRREIKLFQNFYPLFVKIKAEYTYVEPFVGGGAVYFDLNNLQGKNVINDFDSLLINFYEQFQQGNKELINELSRISKITNHDKLEKEYYHYRNMDRNKGLEKVSNTEKAIRFFIVNQLAFSGMRRFNSDGEFNVPFGHYKGLNSDVLSSKEHYALLNNTKIMNCDFERVMRKYDEPKTFQFIDSPYTRVFKTYSANNEFGVEDHKRLAKTFKEVKNASIMIIIDKSELTMELYNDYIKHSYPLKYGVNIKNRFSQAVEHLVICNY